VADALEDRIGATPARAPAQLRNRIARVQVDRDAAHHRDGVARADARVRGADVTGREDVAQEDDLLERDRLHGVPALRRSVSYWTSAAPPRTVDCLPCGTISMRVDASARAKA